MYAYQDRYGWTVAANSYAPRRIRMAAWNAPRTFATRAEAEAWIAGVV
jgi:hypothetical protein